MMIDGYDSEYLREKWEHVDHEEVQWEAEDGNAEALAELERRGHETAQTVGALMIEGAELWRQRMGYE